MRTIGALASLILILLVLLDGFETIVQPRRVTRRYSYARFFYGTIWGAWRAMALRLPSGKRREAFLSAFGPASLLLLFATWFFGLIFSFAVLHWSLATAMHAPEQRPTFITYLYLSGTTFFTLGYGDVTPVRTLGRILAVVEAGLGFGFLAAMLSYLPMLFQAFSRRETSISLLDARAGSPPSAAQLLLRLARSSNSDRINAFLVEWERWAAELLESHLSFPVLGYYRSQHDNQSWLATLTMILDTCTLLLVAVKNADIYQAQLTFAMARHAAVDLTLVLRTPAGVNPAQRLSPEQLQRLRSLLGAAGVALHDRPELDERIRQLVNLYEPFIHSLALHFLFPVPPIVPLEDDAADNWQKSAWMPRSPGIGSLPLPSGDEGHFG
ncbi:MAG TPA: potassium channel family protein [Tepidisphaeraceae bacterium]